MADHSHNMCGLLLIHLILIIVFNGLLLSEATENGTTHHFKDIILGRCWDYMRQKSNLVSSQAQNCTKVWEVFSKAFLYKNPCDVTAEDYVDYFDLVKSKRKFTKTLFWSGTYKAVHDYSDFELRFTTLEDTLPGFLVDELSWCGSKTSSDGLDYRTCPETSSKCHYITAFWADASERFAKDAKGVAYVMVNGSRIGAQGKSIPAYSKSSFFGSKELPNIDVTQVHKMSIIVVHTPGGQEFESCGKGSVKQLAHDCLKHGIKEVSCTDDPDSVHHILCADFPDEAECKFLSGYKSKQILDKYRKLVIILGILLAVVTVIAMLLIIIPYVRKNCCNKSIPDFERFEPCN